MLPRKPDARAIVEFVDELARETWLDTTRQPWPHELYHFSDIRNIVGIIHSGKLYSRAECDRLGIAHVDSADREIISQHIDRTHAYARLYFRPRTPMLYRVEGIRSPDRVYNGAHCPVPVYLVFDSKAILTQFGVEFTDGNAVMSRTSKGYDATFLRALPFKLIYHNASYPPERRDEIVWRRHAEVLVPGLLELDALTSIVCRTGAERETLLHLLGADAIEWEHRVRLERVGEQLFYRLGVYVSEVSLTPDHVIFAFQPSKVIGPFAIRLEVWEARTGRVLVDTTKVHEHLQARYNAPVEPRIPVVRVRLTVSDCLAYDAEVSRQRLF